jgi:exopolysaccharide biosynthesis polyprenyl glycosylphosphotransferase
VKKTLLLYRYLIFDIIASLAVWVAFTYFRQMANDGAIFQDVRVFVPRYYFVSSIICYPFLCMFFHWLSGFYQQPLELTKTSILLSTFITSIFISIFIFFALLLDDSVAYQNYYHALLVLFALNFFIVLFFRLIIYYNVRQKFKKKIWATQTAIIGTGTMAEKIANELRKHSDKEHFIGFIAVKKTAKHQLKNVLGNVSDIEKLILENKIDKIIIALDAPSDFELFSLINSLFAHNIEVSFTPRLNEILTGSARMENPKISPLVSVTRPSMSNWQSCVKRFFDIVVSVLCLIIGAVPMLVIAICIKVDSKGTVFFRQERIGRFGVPFNILKFRSMMPTAENGVPMLSDANDKRTTKVGRILRRYRIDETPQFWNVLCGDMSLVGPRPERSFYIKQIEERAPYYCLLYKIRPGLTSWGPIRIGYSDTLEKMIDRLNYDIIYMDNMSLFIDLKILIYTCEVIFKGKGQ